MDAIKPRLGRGLDALLGAGAEPTGPAARAELGRIRPNPFQPRKRFDDEDLAQLTASIREHGVLQPLVVRAHDDHFQLIAGERRLRAAQLAGLADVPVHVMAFADQQVYEAALAENINRADLNPVEKAQGFKDYLDRYGATQDQLAAKLGIDRTSVSNLVGLLHLPAEVQDAVRNGQVSLGHAKVLKGLSDPARQSALAKQVVLQNLSVRALEALTKEPEAAGGAGKEPAEKPVPAGKSAHVSSVENELKQKLALRVEIRVKAKEKGQIVIGFESNDDFERVLDVLRK